MTAITPTNTPTAAANNPACFMRFTVACSASFIFHRRNSLLPYTLFVQSACLEEPCHAPIVTTSQEPVASSTAKQNLIVWSESSGGVNGGSPMATRLAMSRFCSRVLWK